MTETANAVNDDDGGSTTGSNLPNPANDTSIYQKPQQKSQNKEEPVVVIGVSSSDYSMKPIVSIAIVGGTHGNEYTGVWIIHEMEELLFKTSSSSSISSTSSSNVATIPFQTLYPSLSSYYPMHDITILIGNPIAHEQNRRFVDVDLNRQFSSQLLSSSINNKEESSLLSDKNYGMEVMRAHEINQLLGPKQYTVPNDVVGTSNRNNSSNNNDQRNSTSSSDIHDNMDLIIDLHTTTAAMDCTIFVPQGDVLMIQAAAYAMYQCNQRYSSSSTSTLNNTLSQQPQLQQQQQSEQIDDNQYSRTNNSFDPKALQTNIRFETQIILNHERVGSTSRPFLPSIGKHELTIEIGPVPQGVLRHDAILKTKIAMYYVMEFITLYNHTYDDNNNDNNTAKTDPSIHHVLHDMYPLGTVPCFTDLGKIPWPNHGTNPNFPLYVVHESIQDREYSR
jgi:succinylglutamate desuccinylase